MKIKTTTCEWMRRISLLLTVASFLVIWLEGFGISKGGQRFIDLSQGGYTLWIFLIVGAIIILLQLIPAVILFFNFIGTGTHMVLGKKIEVVKDEECCDEKAKSEV